MTILEKLFSICESANKDYQCIYEEGSMMNVKVDKIKRTESYVYIEEFRSGAYSKQDYRKSKSYRIQIYFSKFVNFKADALVRESLRNEIEKEIVLPFMDAYNKTSFFKRNDTWQFYYPIPRFDANEVSVMLEFNCIENIC